jgi:hypothetical protein
MAGAASIAAAAKTLMFDMVHLLRRGSTRADQVKVVANTD